MTQWLPRELCEALIRKLRPGQRYPLRQLPEFAALVDRVTETENTESGGKALGSFLLDATLDQITCALLEGDLPLLERLLTTSGYEVPQSAAWVAASAGRIATVKWAIDKKRPWHPQACSPLLWKLWQRNTGNYSTPHCLGVMRWAATVGYLELAEWAVGYGCPLELNDDQLCIRAAEGGHINFLRWLRENGCHWDSRTSTGAAEHGHMELLHWAVENGCPCDEPEIICSLEAAEGKQLM